MGGRRAAALAAVLGLFVACQESEESSEPRLHEAPWPEVSPLAAPTISMVRNEDGGVQVREASQTVVVITGTDLASATDVTVGSCFPQILGATATELRVDSGCFGVTRGMISVSVTTPDGTASVPDALEITPFVISPSAAMNGRGTYESPLNLCDPIIPNWSGSGNKLELLGGVHRCGNFVVLSTGLVIEGAADGSTVVQGDGSTGFTALLNHHGGTLATVVRRLTFAAPLGDQSLSISFPEFEGADVTIEDVAGGRIGVANATNIVIDEYDFDGPAPAAAPGLAALDLSGVQLTLTDAAVRCESGTGTFGILLRSTTAFHFGNVAAERVRVSHCGRGVQVCELGGSPWQRQVQLRELELLDNDVGMDVHCGMVTVTDSEIAGDPMTAQPSRIGLELNNGVVEFRDTEIRGQSFAGVAQYTSSGGGGPEPVASLLLSGVEIVGAEYGVDFSGFDGGTDIVVRRSVLRGQSKACVRTHGYESQLDFGTEFDPGGNAFSVLPGGFAIDDVRNDTLPDYFYLNARGTTLNGLSFDTAIVEGPASLPPYFRVARGISGIRF